MLETVNYQATKNTQSQFTEPKLWVADVVGGRNFHSLVEVHGYQDNEYTTGGNHYILVTPEVREIEVKSLLWRLQQSGEKCFIHHTNFELSQIASNQKAAGEFFADQVVEFARADDQWLRWIEEQPLTAREAVDLAKIAMAQLGGTDREVELNTLRQRSKHSAKEWERTMGYLEAELRREIARRQGEPEAGNPDDKLRLSLLALLGESDPIVYYRKRAEICSHFRLSKSEVERLLKILSNRTRQLETNTYSVEQLMALESEGLQWLIPELLPKGETIILSASPKAGKTLLAIDAAFAIATGEDSFLGETVKRGKVLLISCDESRHSTKNKLINRGFRSQDHDIRVVTEWTIDQIEALETVLEDFRPDVVIVDSLRRINHGSKISENSAEFADNIYTLKETIGRYGASGILIHHTNKDKDALGVGKLRGSSAIAGAVWGTWQLEHIPVDDPNNPKKQIIDPKDPRRVLSVFARDTEGQTLKIEFNPENNSWVRLDEESRHEELTLQQRILKVLGLNPNGLSGKGINECLGEEGRGIYTVLSRMVNRRLVSCKPSSGDKRINIYKLPQEEIQRDTLPPPVTDPVLTNSSESIGIQGKINSQQNSQHSKTEKQASLAEKQVLTNLNQDTASNSEKIVNTQTIKEGGEGVSNLNSSTESDTLPNYQRVIPVYKEGERVKFQHESFNGWRKGKIKRVNIDRGYFVDYEIEWNVRTKSGIWNTLTVKLANQNWMRRL